MNEPSAVPLSMALHQIGADPGNSQRWHTLFNLYVSEPQAPHRAAVHAHILRHAPSTGEAGFLRETFMAAVTDDHRHSAHAGEILKTLTPLHADRLLAFCVYEWGVRLQRQGGLSQLAKDLRAACVPELMALVGNTLPRPALKPDHLQQPIREPGTVARVAVVTSYVSNANHPPTVLAIQQAQLLREAGLQVGMFSSQETRVQNMGTYLGNNGQLLTPPPDSGTLLPLIPAGVNLAICNEQLPLVERYNHLMAAIAAFNPDVVLFVGLNSPVMTPLYHTWPTLGLCIHAMQPMAPVDVWLTSDPAQANRLCSTWGAALPPAWGVHHPYRVMPKPTAALTPWPPLPWPNSQVVLVTVGARLRTEISGEWAVEMCDFLRQHPSVSWLLVGGDGSVPPALAGVGHTQLAAIPHQDNLKGIFNLCHVYVNPERMGGGFSVAEAMAEGMAVIALADSDGGNKVGESAALDRSDFFAKLQQVTTDADTRNRLGSLMRDRFTQALDLTRSGPSLVAACHVALERFSVRQNSTNHHSTGFLATV